MGYISVLSIWVHCCSHIPISLKSDGLLQLGETICFWLGIMVNVGNVDLGSTAKSK